MRASTPHGRRRNHQVELQHPGHGEEEGGIGGSMADTGGRPEVSLATVRSPGHPAAATTAAAAADPGHADTGQEKPTVESTRPANGATPMGECGTEYRGLPDGEAGGPMPSSARTVSMIPLIFLIFYEVSGGPFGIEDSVGAAGPLLAIIGFLVLPVIWSIPEALITAELGAMFPENGGYVVWVASALGPYWGFQQGWMKWLSGVIDNALYPVLFLDYLKSGVPALGGGAPRAFAVVGLTAVLTLLNYRGLTVVGWVAISLGVFSLLPFFVMGLIALPKLRPARWLVIDLHNVDWNLYLNTLFWNLNYWDSISTLAGEVKNPGKTLPKALFYAVIFVVVAYLYPLLAGTGAVPLDRGQWTDGYFADIAKLLGGAWLMWWVQSAAALSNMGMFVAEMSSDSYQLLGMAERGMLPSFFAVRSRYGTPLAGILFSASGVLLLSTMSFQEIVAAENFLYCFGMLLEFVAFILHRVRRPDAARPYRVPLGTVGCVAMLVPPTALIAVVLALSTLKVAVVSLGTVAVGLVLQPALRFVEKKRWLRFSVNPDLPEIGVIRPPAAPDEPLVP
uniref:Polyamine transporter PUT1 n=1 Tax=Oryza meridionalis TaxID=40149 RepID=A0A0E0CQ82_9ORYZ